ncbi:hypothetical protein C4588_07505 [Candidatus Parcubacteria bacterium]|jgi:hypothetical protein|nr:MAG: hypothetical protein C4588_07505 [Candidatus Parcubacteria bacterium]
MSSRTNNTIKLILAIVTAVAAFYLGSQNASSGVSSSLSDSTVTVDTNKIKAQHELLLKQKFTLQIADSIKKKFPQIVVTNYVKENINLDSLKMALWEEAEVFYKTNSSSIEVNNNIYTAEADSQFTLTDSNGVERGNVSIQSIFASRLPIDPESKLLLSIKHSLMSYDTTIKESSILTHFKPVVFTAYGYGLTSKQWDWFTGVGVGIEFIDLIKKL